jgi:hypothetical protein
MEYGPDVNKCLTHLQSFHPIIGLFQLILLRLQTKKDHLRLAP